MTLVAIMCSGIGAPDDGTSSSSDEDGGLDEETESSEGEIDEQLKAQWGVGALAANPQV